MGRTPACAQLALVGPGSELQLTLDGRAVPHEVVVAESERRDAVATGAITPALRAESGRAPDRWASSRAHRVVIGESG